MENTKKVQRITLPSQLNTPSNNLFDYRYMLAGVKKVGKTSFCAQFKNHIILECEVGNAKHLKCRYIDIGSWNAFLQVLNLLEKNQNYCDMICVDDIPSLHSYCESFVCRNLGIDHPSELDYGKGWSSVKNELNKGLVRLHNLKKGVIYTAHTSVVDHKDKKGKKWSRIETTCSGIADRIMDNLCHFWAVMDYDENKEREMIIQGDISIKAGHGLNEHFKTKEGKPIRSIKLGNSPQQAFINFEKAFNNEYANGNDSKPTVKSKKFRIKSQT